MQELQVLVNKLKVVNMDILEAFQVCAIIANFSSLCKRYIKKLLHNFEEFSLEKIHKHLWIKEESKDIEKTEADGY